jgi:hypothetical protein
MKGIYYKDGIYVLIDNEGKNDIHIQHSKYKPEVSLFGGRVEIKTNSKAYIGAYADLIVDGISIVKIYGEHKSIHNYLTYTEIVHHLNAMEANGVDAFMENYKESVKFAYSELKELTKETEFQLSSESEESLIKSLKSELSELKDILFKVFALLFSLNTFMSAGLENEKVISVCQSLLDSLA